MAATTAAAGATGLRAWLATKGLSWLTPRRLRATTVGLVALGLLGAATGLGGT